MTAPDWQPVPNALLAWLMNGETGTSSLTMAGRFIGFPLKREGHPWDPADFRRCLLLLKAVPAVRSVLPGLAATSPGWKALAGAWDELEALFLEELTEAGGASLTELPIGATAPRTFARMKELIDNPAAEATPARPVWAGSPKDNRERSDAPQD